ncbi:glycosyltransferase [Maribacter forsetii]|uniref:glycosyltransferase n=1 Tax=Maribacter forsetii TaxID=444515 RepID=UPI00068BC4D4|nr:glycosyltransferase [Maribacter forsetii]
MKNICFVISSFKKSGPINIVYNIAKFLDKGKFNVYVISLSKTTGNDSNSINDFNLLGVTTHELSNGRLAGLIKNKKEIKLFFKENNIDIIHSHGLRPDALVCRLGIKAKHIATLHNFPFDDYPMKYGIFKGKLMAYYHVMIIKKIVNVVTCSKSLSIIFKERIDFKVDYVQNGVDFSEFSTKCDKLELRKKLQLPLDKKIFIFIGSLIPRKNPLETIRKFTEVKIRDEFCLLVLGDGFLMNACQALKESNILIKGNVSNVISYLFASDYFISLSKSEGLPNTVMEAMAAKLPVMLSDIPSHLEILDINKHAGVSVNQDNFDIKFQELVAGDYGLFSESSYNIILNSLNAQNMTDNYQNVYLNLN